MTEESRPQRRMHWLAILQVSLLNVAVTTLIVPLDSTLNRIMIAELGLSATLVALLISLRFITSPLRIWLGRISDTRPIAGRYRTWYIAGGMTLIILGFILTPHAAFSIERLGSLGIFYSFCAFALLGFGVNLTTPLYLALVADQSSEEQRSRIMATMFILLGITVVITSSLISLALEPYSPEQLIRIFYVIAAVTAAMTVLGLIGLERPKAKLRSEVGVRAPKRARMRDLLLHNKEVSRFFLYLVLTFVAVEAQEVILEPYAATAFSMSPSETTRLTAVFRVGSLVMLAVGAFIVRRAGYRVGAFTGIGLGVVGLILIIASGPLGSTGPFMGGVLVFGLASGALTITNLSLMMRMTDTVHAGVFLGAWGFAQAVGVGAGTLLGGVIRDVGQLLSGSDLGGYETVFGFEIVLLLVAIPVVVKLNLERFRELNAKAELGEAVMQTEF